MGQSFESPTAVENRFALETFGDLRGKKLLEMGCGAGEASVYFALKGARVTAIDISAEFVKLTKALARKYNVMVNVVKMQAEKLAFRDGEFDCIFGNSILHHAELQLALREAARFLKGNGKPISIEPLAHNPLINIYRRMARDVHTPTEAPLRMKEVEGMRRYFAKMSHQEFWLFALGIFVYFYFIRRYRPCRDRYWKKVIEGGERYAAGFRILKGIDQLALKWLPILRRFCWNTVVVLEHG